MPMNAQTTSHRFLLLLAMLLLGVAPTEQAVAQDAAFETQIQGPPNQPLRDVYEKVTAEMDASMAAFDSSLTTEMAEFDGLAN
jgi:hypothetical protein